MEVTYRMQDGFQIPNLLMPQEPEVHLGKYAELRRQYLKKHRRVLYTNLKTSCRLTEHLAEIEQAAKEMVSRSVQRMAEAEGLTEQMKDFHIARLRTGEDLGAMSVEDFIARIQEEVATKAH